MNGRRTTFGSSMQLLSIENLSLAAEATVALLLLTLVWPQKKIEQAGDTTSGEAVSWVPAKFYYLQTCLHRGLYLHQWRQTQNRNSTHSTASVPFLLRQIDDEENRSNMPLPWQDRLTNLLNRHGFDSVLKEWLSIEPMHRGNSCLSMITLFNYSDMVSTQGAMVAEQAIQRFASHLAVALSGDSLVARYLPDRFVVLHYASTVAGCHEAMECIQHGISEEGFFKVAGQSQSLESIVSIVDLHVDSDVASSMDELEEGILEADRSGRKIVSRVDDSKTIVANKVKAEDDESIASSDISAVANADDIAALFTQINSNKVSQSKETSKLANDSPEAIDSDDAPLTVETPATAVAVDLSEAASADDIASLFATVQSAGAPKVFEGPKPILEAKAPEPSRPAEKELSDAASSDDIAALFASIKPVQASVQSKLASANTRFASADPDSDSLSNKDLLVKPTSTNTVDLSSAASADDIEALFAQMKK